MEGTFVLRSWQLDMDMSSIFKRGIATKASNRDVAPSGKDIYNTSAQPSRDSDIDRFGTTHNEMLARQHCRQYHT
eukprot:m.1667967 g.1667967  ORF g.1667967 m.1667967 type:complete len:75 (+) comp150585_c0_seq1:71-295(+)